MKNKYISHVGHHFVQLNLRTFNCAYSLILFLLISPVILFASSPSLLTIKTPEKSITFNVEIAKTPAEQAYGLMDRKTLAKNAGMLFVYENASELSFWMKNTLIPLDIIFIDASKKIVGIQTMTPCHEIACPIYNSKKPAQYALEINAGLSKQYRLSAGNAIALSNKLSLRSRF